MSSLRGDAHAGGRREAASHRVPSAANGRIAVTERAREERRRRARRKGGVGVAPARPSACIVRNGTGLGDPITLSD
eukprot:6110041-Prymnesium_polylepis.1